MEYEFEAWFKTGLHRNIKCVDCHLPNNNFAEYMIWKGIDGLNTIIRYNTNLFPESIAISSHGKKMLQANCIRCHEDMVSSINTEERVFPASLRFRK
jgi:cytochrome c nitrite reductase small subunit